MKTKEQIEESAYNYFKDRSDEFFDRKEASMYSYQAGYEQAQRDFQESISQLQDKLYHESRKVDEIKYVVASETEQLKKKMVKDFTDFFEKGALEGIKKGYEQAQKDFKEREAKLVDGLKFYADQRSWKTEGSIDDNSFISVIEDDDMYQDKDDAGLFYIGGKRAREVLKELGEL